MKHFTQLNCKYCSSTDLVKNGHDRNGAQRYRCNICKKSFRTSYSYNAYKDGIKDKIDELTLNSCGVRDISRTLKISQNTVISHLKKKS